MPRSWFHCVLAGINRRNDFKSTNHWNNFEPAISWRYPSSTKLSIYWISIDSESSCRVDVFLFWKIILKNKYLESISSSQRYKLQEAGNFDVSWSLSLDVMKFNAKKNVVDDN